MGKPILVVDEHIAKRNEILRRLIRMLSWVGVVAYAPSVWLSAVEHLWGLVVINTIVIASVFFVAYGPWCPESWYAGYLIGVSMALGVAVLFATGPYGAGYIWLIAGVAISALIGKRWAVAAAIVFALVVFIAYGVLSRVGILPDYQSLESLGVTAANFIATVFALAYLIFNLNSGMMESLRASDAANLRLQGKLWEIDQISADLAKNLDLKQLMLKELNHRVKNNIQVISSLVRLARSRKDRSSDENLEQLSQRIDAIGAVHSLLYSESYAGTVILNRLVRSIVDKLSHADGAGNITFDLELTDEVVSIETDRAVQLAIALNEIITNAFKHAFPAASTDPRIAVSLGLNGNAAVLEIRDNGQGSETLHRPDGLGVSMTRKIIDQSGADYEVDGADGVRWTIRIPLRSDV